MVCSISFRVCNIFYILYTILSMHKMYVYNLCIYTMWCDNIQYIWYTYMRIMYIHICTSDMTHLSIQITQGQSSRSAPQGPFQWARWEAGPWPSRAPPAPSWGPLWGPHRRSSACKKLIVYISENMQAYNLCTYIHIHILILFEWYMYTQTQIRMYVRSIKIYTYVAIFLMYLHGEAARSILSTQREASGARLSSVRRSPGLDRRRWKTSDAVWCGLRSI